MPPFLHADAVFSRRAVPVTAQGGRGGPEVGAVGWVTSVPTDISSLGQKQKDLVCACVYFHILLSVEVKTFLGSSDILAGPHNLRTV